jgi:FkbH-like protein
MAARKRKCLLLSSFTIDNFSGYLSNSTSFPALDVVTIPAYDNVIQFLLESDNSFWNPKPEFAIIWLTPDRVCPSFRKVMDYKSVTEEVLGEEVKIFTDLVTEAARRTEQLFIPSWVIPGNDRGLGSLDMKSPLGIRRTLMKMNLQLMEVLSPVPNIFILDTTRWIMLAGKGAYNPLLWYMAKIPFSKEVFKEAVSDIKAAMAASLGLRKKLVIVDLDNTLWGGIVGEMGWENLQLGGHDPIGEAFVDFQKGLKRLTGLGIVLGVVSKNEEVIALEGIRKHPEMVIRQEDLVAWRINWQDKAANIVSLTEELNLGLNSVVFIDDNPRERSRVREALPEVLVPEWPGNPLLYRTALDNLRCFDSITVTEEDRGKTGLYQSELARKNDRRRLPSLNAWLKTLEIKIRAEELNQTNLPRAVQLLNKTNQMNLRTRRLSENVLKEWANQDSHNFWVIFVEDKFGESGLTGIISLEYSGKSAIIADFVLSCRVIGRKVEETLLAFACCKAKEMGATEMLAEYRPTPKNKPCLDFFHRSDFISKPDDDIFRWSLEKEYLFPEEVTFIGSERG